MRLSPKKHLLELDRVVDKNLDRDKFLRMDKNENLKGFSKEIIQDIQKMISSDFLTAYPEVDPLYNKLAEHLNIPRDKIFLSAGSDAGIKAVYEVYVDSGDEVIVINPTYAMYHVYSKMFDAQLVKVDFDENLVLPPERIIEEISPATKLVCIANPNSPTGTVFPIQDLEKIIKVASKNDALVLVDEAYYQFWGFSAIDLVLAYDNLIVIRTFSKALGLASARLGYVVSNPEIISHLFRVRPMYEVNAFAVSLGVYILEHLELVDQHITEIQNAREWLEKELFKDDLSTVPGAANFILINVGGNEKAAQIAKELLGENIVIKGGFRDACLKPYIRVGLGTLEHMRIFLKKFRKILRELA